MTEDRKNFLIVSSLRQRATLEANLHYGGDITKGIAGELVELAAEFDAPASTKQEDTSWLE